MKKFLAILLMFVMLLSLSACGGSNIPEQTVEESETTSSSEPAESSEPEESSEEEAPVSGEITLEALMNAPESPESDFECIDSGEGEVKLLTYIGSSEIVVIPETWNGKKITSIASYVFANDSPVRAIRMSSSVKVIMEYSFGLNSNLEIVVCGNNLETIEKGAFQSCSNLREIVLNEGLLGIGELSFSNLDSLLSIEVPSTVTEIHYSAFVILPEDFTMVVTAGSYAEEYAKTSGIPFEVK